MGLPGPGFWPNLSGQKASGLLKSSAGW